MGNFIQGTQLRTLNQGSIVTKAAANLPQSATATLYTVAGGAVLVTGLVGIVTTAIASSDPVLSLGTAPTVGTAQTSGIATTTVLTSAEAGTLVSVVGATTGLPTALAVMATAAKAGSTVFLGTPFVVSAGTITWTTGASKTGALKWYLTYIPLDDGASVS
jgi:hypothetical protein